jgi:hypothetical protein
MVRVSIYKVKKSVELPKIENRLPDQKIDKRLGSPFNIGKSSNPNLNININININNPVATIALKSAKPDCRVEICQSFFKKPFEYISPNNFQGESTILNYNSFIYNKNYLRSVERITKIFMKNNHQSPQIQPIQLNNFTVIQYLLSMLIS